MYIKTHYNLFFFIQLGNSCKKLLTEPRHCGLSYEPNSLMMLFKWHHYFLNYFVQYLRISLSSSFIIIRLSYIFKLMRVSLHSMFPWHLLRTCIFEMLFFFIAGWNKFSRKGNILEFQNRKHSIPTKFGPKYHNGLIIMNLCQRAFLPDIQLKIFLICNSKCCLQTEILTQIITIDNSIDQWSWYHWEEGTDKI